MRLIAQIASGIGPLSPAGLELERLLEASASERKLAVTKMTVVVADVLAATIPGVPIISVAALMARVIAEHPEALEHLRNPAVTSIAEMFAEKLVSARHESNAEIRAVDETLPEVLTLPEKIRAAAFVVLLGACGSATWDATKYLYEITASNLGASTEIVEADVDAFLPGVYQVTGDGLRVRAEPSEEGEILALLPKELTVVAQYQKGEWIAVVASHSERPIAGWVSQAFLKPLGSAESR